MTLIASPCPEGQDAQVAFLIPKKVGPAVVRNQVRRRMREIHRRKLAPIAPARLRLWLAKPLAAKLSFAELTLVMQRLCLPSSS
jgi:ribonuclease P protein component